MKEGGKRRERSFLMLSFLTKKISIFKQNQEGDGRRLSLNYHKLSKVGNFIDGQIFIRSYSLSGFLIANLLSSRMKLCSRFVLSIIKLK